MKTISGVVERRPRTIDYRLLLYNLCYAIRPLPFAQSTDVLGTMIVYKK